jgi:parallel beta-helix repeat protein
MEQLNSLSSKSLSKLEKKLKPFSLLLIVVFGVFTFANSFLFSAASATYVEGDITQDTVWTLMDSPFVVSKNVTVYPNATLTIEPGVEVRFGGNFWLIVNGRLIANGTPDNMITFTSNKHQPQAGDWGTIIFSNRTLQSTLAYCSVKYATNGTTIENGNVEIQNCEISSNSKNGITIEDGTAAIRNNEITNNTQSGIYVTGDNNQVTIQDNTIRSNANGILLTGSSASGVNIRQNNVLSNTQSGIQLDANAYSNVDILYNVLSANNRGFYVSGQASTSITNNSISYNTIGIFYQKPTYYLTEWTHMARWNDIYGNEWGMDVSSNVNVTVDAEYNYWGDESGPYHTSLNPDGKGDPVGGDGASLDFIFFLTAPIGYINERPTARLLTDKTLVPPNQTVTFIATTSSDDKRVDQYLFDFGDGKNSGWTTLSIFVHQYSSVGTYDARVTVMDDFGVISTNVAKVTINVQNLSPLDVSLTPSAYTIGSEEQVSVTVHVTDGANAVENASITLFSIKAGSFTPSSGFTNSSGYFTTTFTAPNITQITNVRITATASKSGYADGTDYKYLEVLPILLVQVTADPTSIVSEATSNVKVHVTSVGQSIANATITISSDGGGNFSAQTGTTDSNGDFTFVFTAPQTTAQLNITITATATKTGYIDGQGQTKLTIEPRILVIQFAGSPTTIDSEEIAQMTVLVTYNGTPIPDATITLSSDGGGSFSATNGTTNSNGYYTFTFAAPQTSTQFNVTITATAAKSGYVDGEDQVTITVTPKTVPGPGVTGLPLTTLILIIAAIAVVVVVIVLFKLNIIGITWAEE